MKWKPGTNASVINMKFMLSPKDNIIFVTSQWDFFFFWKLKKGFDRSRQFIFWTQKIGPQTAALRQKLNILTTSEDESRPSVDLSTSGNPLSPRPWNFPFVSRGFCFVFFLFFFLFPIFCSSSSRLLSFLKLWCGLSSTGGLSKSEWNNRFNAWKG